MVRATAEQLYSLAKAHQMRMCLSSSDPPSYDESYQMIGTPQDERRVVSNVKQDSADFKRFEDEITRKNKEIEIITKLLDAKTIANATLEATFYQATLEQIEQLKAENLAKVAKNKRRKILHKKEIRKKDDEIQKAVEKCNTEKVDDIKSFVDLFSIHNSFIRSLQDYINLACAIGLGTILFETLCFVIMKYFHKNATDLDYFIVYVFFKVMLLFAYFIVKWHSEDKFAPMQASYDETMKRVSKPVLGAIAHLVGSGITVDAKMNKSTRTLVVPKESATEYGLRLSGNFVSSIVKGSAAAAAGLRKGEEILSINGKSAQNMSGDWIQTEFKGAGESVQLELRYSADHEASLRQYEQFLRNEPVMV